MVVVMSKGRGHVQRLGVAHAHGGMCKTSYKQSIAIRHVDFLFLRPGYKAMLVQHIAQEKARAVRLKKANKIDWYAHGRSHYVHTFMVV